MAGCARTGIALVAGALILAGAVLTANGIYGLA